MVVKLPVEAKSNNATSVDKTTYTWDLTKANSVELEFELKNTNNNLIMIIGGACAVAAIAICVVALVLKNKKENK